MATAKRHSKSVRKVRETREPESKRARASRDKRKMLPVGNHLAPFRSRAGNPVIVVIWRGDYGARLFAMGEVTEMRGAQFWTNPRGARMDDRWKYIPQDERLLPRGVHRAPWRVPAGLYRGDGVVETFLAIDSEHRLVEMLQVRPFDDGTPDKAGEAEAERFLAALLDSHEATQAEAEAARDPNDPAPVPDSWGFCRFSAELPSRGIWSRHNHEYYFVDSDKKHIATLEFHNGYERTACPFDLTRTIRRIMAWLDPRGEDDDDDDDDDRAAEAWKRG